MTDLNRRVQKMESKLEQGSIDGARQFVGLMQELGMIGPDEDIESLIAETAAQGLSMKKLLDEIDGTSLGPPSLRGNHNALTV